eukprot:1230147-Rhodomonas_salina.1
MWWGAANAGLDHAPAPWCRQLPRCPVLSLSSPPLLLLLTSSSPPSPPPPSPFPPHPPLPPSLPILFFSSLPLLASICSLTAHTHTRCTGADVLLCSVLIRSGSWELVLFTAGLPDYASPIIDQLDPKR